MYLNKWIDFLRILTCICCGLLIGATVAHVEKTIHRECLIPSSQQNFQVLFEKHVLEKKSEAVCYSSQPAIATHQEWQGLSKQIGEFLQKSVHDLIQLIFVT